MKKNLNYIEAIETLLKNRGISERKFSSTLATILGLQYNSAKQKLDGKRGINLEEIRAVFRYFDEPFEGGRNFNCVFVMNNIHKRCTIEVEQQKAKDLFQNETYAIKKDGIFIIDTNQRDFINAELYKVESISFLPPPKVAILDNNGEILELLKKITERYGIEAHTYTTNEEILQAIQTKKYEVYILDWLLDYNKTAECVVDEIKKTSDSTIIILTGQLDNFEASIGDMILKHNVNLIEKPAKPKIISSMLLSTLFYS